MGPTAPETSVCTLVGILKIFASLEVSILLPWRQAELLFPLGHFPLCCLSRCAELDLVREHIQD